MGSTTEWVKGKNWWTGRQNNTNQSEQQRDNKLET